MIAKHSTAIIAGIVIGIVWAWKKGH